MQFLDRARRGAGGNDAIVGHRPRRAAIATAEYDTRHAHSSALFESPEYVRGFPGGGDAEEDVLAGYLAGDLPREYLVVAIVVADGGEDGAIHRKRFRGQRRAVAGKFAHEFRRKMLGIGRRTAISGDVDAAAITIAFYHGVHGLRENAQLFFVAEKLLLSCDRIEQIFLENSNVIQVRPPQAASRPGARK